MSDLDEVLLEVQDTRNLAKRLKKLAENRVTVRTVLKFPSSITVDLGLGLLERGEEPLTTASIRLISGGRLIQFPVSTRMIGISKVDGERIVQITLRTDRPGW
ncbi:MAG: hypothetical protein WDZ70_01125 [Candidatus Paceibacterota bacterium]